VLTNAYHLIDYDGRLCTDPVIPFIVYNVALINEKETIYEDFIYSNSPYFFK